MPKDLNSPNSWPPLGLPTGSVRALLTMIVVGVVTQAIVRSRTLEPIWVETLLIALAWYFTSRRFMSLPPDVLQRLEREGVIEREGNPLFLPRHSIRFLLIANFSALAFWLHNQGRLTEPKSVSLFLMLGAVIIGSLFRGIKSLLGFGKQTRWSSRWGDLRAVVVISCVLIAAGCRILEQNVPLLPEFDRVALVMVLFYFGAR